MEILGLCRKPLNSAKPRADARRMGKKKRGGEGRPIPAELDLAVMSSALEDAQRELRTLIDELRSAANQWRVMIRAATDDVANVSASTRRLVEDVTRETQHCRAEAQGIRASSAAFADSFDAQQRAYLDELQRRRGEALVDLDTSLHAWRERAAAQAAAAVDEVTRHTLEEFREFQLEFEAQCEQLIVNNAGEADGGDATTPATYDVGAGPSELDSMSAAYEVPDATTAGSPAISWSGSAADHQLEPAMPGAPEAGTTVLDAAANEVLAEPSYAPAPVSDFPEPEPTPTDDAWPLTGSLPADASMRRPVNVVVPFAALRASVEVLTRGAADQRVRVEIARAPACQDSLFALRLTVHSIGGWWECHDLPARIDSFEPQSVLIELGGLNDAIELVQPGEGPEEVALCLDGDVTLGNVLLLGSGTDEPVLTHDRKLVERVQLDDLERAGAILETQLGRFTVSARLVSFLRRRHAESADLVVVDGRPSLWVTVPGPSPGIATSIVTALDRDGESTVDVKDRRRARGSEVTDLVVAMSPSTTGEQLREILDSGVPYARRRAAAHPALSRDDLRQLVRDGTEAMRAAAAANPSLDRDAAAFAVGDASPVVRASLASNPNVGVEILDILASDESAEVRASAAANANLSTPSLSRLARDGDALIRIAAAQRPQLSLDAFASLAGDVDTRVCAAVATNPECPSELMRELLEIVPEAVLANRAAATSLLIAGSQADSSALRVAVAGNVATPAARLTQMAGDRSPDVVRAVADNPTTPAKARRRAQRRLRGNQLGRDEGE